MMRSAPMLVAALALVWTAPAAAVTTVEAKAGVLWNDTGVDVRAGETLAVNVSGEWSDLTITTNADGYASPWNMRLFEGLRRLPKARWFALIGCVGHGHRHCQVMSSGAQTLVMPATGRFYLFANDVRGFYWNNTGALTVAIAHRAPPP